MFGVRERSSGLGWKRKKKAVTTTAIQSHEDPVSLGLNSFFLTTVNVSN